MLKPNLWGYSHAYILSREIVTITGHGDHDTVKLADERNKDVILQNCPTSENVQNV